MFATLYLYVFLILLKTTFSSIKKITKRLFDLLRAVLNADPLSKGFIQYFMILPNTIEGNLIDLLILRCLRVGLL